LTMALI